MLWNILIEDFNSHHSLWESLRIESQDRKMEKLVENPNITFLNTDAATQFMPVTLFHAIDLTISCTRLVQRIKWRV